MSGEVRSRVSVGDEDAANGVEMKAVYSALDGHDPGGRDMRPAYTWQPATGNRLYPTPRCSAQFLRARFASAGTYFPRERSNHCAFECAESQDSEREVRIGTCRLGLVVEA